MTSSIKSAFLSSIIFADTLVIYCLLHGLFGDVRVGFSYHQHRGLRSGIYAAVYPTVLCQLLLLESVLRDVEHKDDPSLQLRVLRYVDFVTIALLLIFVVRDCDVGYYRGISEYLSINVITISIPILFAFILLGEVIYLVKDTFWTRRIGATKTTDQAPAVKQQLSIIEPTSLPNIESKRLNFDDRINTGQVTPEATPEIGISSHHTGIILPTMENTINFPRRVALLATTPRNEIIDQDNMLLSSRASIATLAPSFYTTNGGIMDDNSLSDEDTVSVPERVRQIGESILDSLRHLGESMQTLPDDIHVRTIERKRSEVFVGLEFREKSSPWNANSRTPPPRFLDHVEQDAEVQTDDIADSSLSLKTMDELHAENSRLMGVEQELQVVIRQLSSTVATHRDALTDAHHRLQLAEEELLSLKGLLESQEVAATNATTEKQQELSTAQAMIKALEAQIATHKLQLDIKTSEHHELKHDREVMQSHLDRVQAQLSQQTAQAGVEHGQLVDQLTTAQERVLQLEQDLSQTLTRLHEQTNSSTQQDAMIQSQTEQVTVLTAALDTAKASCNDHLQQLLQAQAINDSRTRTIKEQEAKIEEYQQRIATLAKGNSYLQNRLDEVEEQAQTLQSENQSKYADNTALQLQLQDAVAAMETHNLFIQQQQQQQQQQQKIADLEEQLSLAQQSIQELKTTPRKLTTRPIISTRQCIDSSMPRSCFAREGNETANLRGKVSFEEIVIEPKRNLKQELANLQVKFEEQRVVHEATCHELIATHSALLLSQQAVEDQAKIVEQVKAELLAREQEINDLQLSLADARRTHTNLQASIAELAAKLSSKEAANDDLQQALSTAQHHITEQNLNIASLQQHIAELESKKELLQDQYANMMTENEQLVSHLASQTQALNNNHTDCKRLSTELVATQQSTAMLQADLEAKVAELVTSTKQTQTLQCKIDTMRGKIQELKADILRKDTELANANQLLVASQAEQTIQQDEMTKIKINLRESQALASERAAQISMLTETREQLIQQSSELIRRAGEDDAAIKYKSNEIAKQATEIIQLTSALQGTQCEAREKVIVLETSLATAQAEVTSLQDDKTHLTEELRQLQTANAAVDALLVTNQTLLKASNAANEKLIADMETQRNAFEQSEAEHAHTTSALEEASKTLSKAQAAVISLQTEIEQAMRDLLMIETDKAALEASLADLQSEVDNSNSVKLTLKQEIDDLSTKIIDLEKALDKKQSELNDAQQSLLNQTALLEVQQKALEETELQCQTSSAALKESKALLVTSEAARSSLESEVASMSNELVAANTQLQATTRELSKLTAQLKQAATNLNTKQAELDAEKVLSTDLQKLIAQLQQSLADKTEVVVKQVKALHESENMHLVTLASLEGTKASLVLAEASLSQAQQKLNDTETALAEKNSQYTAVTAQNDQLAQEMKTITDQTSSDIQDKDVKIAKLTLDTKQLQELLSGTQSEANDKVVELLAALADAGQKLRTSQDELIAKSINQERVELTNNLLKEELTQHMQQSQQLINQLHSEIGWLQADAASNSNDLQAAISQVRSLDDKLSLTNAALQIAQDNLTASKDVIKMKEAAIQDLEEERAKLAEDVIPLQQALSESQALVASKEAEIKSLQVTELKLEAAMAEQQAIINNQSSEITAMQTLLQSQEQGLTEKMVESVALTTVNSHLMTEVQESKETVFAQRAEIDRLSLLLSSSQAEAAAKIDALEAALAMSKEELQAATADSHRLSTLLDDITAAKEALSIVMTQEVQAAQDTISRLQVEHETLLNTQQQMTTDMEHQRHDLEAYATLTQQLEQALASTKKDSAKAETKILKHEAMLDVQRTAAEEKDQMIITLTTALEEIKANLSSSQAEQKRLVEEIENLKAELKERSSEASILAESKTLSSANIMHKDEQIATQAVEIERLLLGNQQATAKTVASLEANLVKLQEESITAYLKIASLENDKSRLQDQLHTKDNDLVVTQHAIDSLSVTLATLKAQEAEVSANLLAKFAAVESLQNDLNKSQTIAIEDKTSLEAEVKRLEALLHSSQVLYDDTIASLQTELDTLRQTLDETQTAFNQLQSDLLAANEESTSLQATMAEQTATLATSNAEREQVLAQVTDLQSNLSTVTEDKSRLEAEAKRFEALLHSNQTLFDDQLATLQIKLNSTIQTLNEAQDAYDQLAALLEAKELKLVTSAFTIAQTQVDLDMSKEENARLQTALLEHKETLAEQTASLAISNEKCALLSSQVSDLQSNLSTATEDRTRLEAEVQRLHDLLDSNQALSNEQIASLRDDLETTIKARDETHATLHQLQAELEAKAQELESSMTRTLMLQAELGHITRENTRLQAVLNEREASFTEQASALVVSNAEREQLVTQVTVVQNSLTTVTEDNTCLEAEVKRLETLLHSSQAASEEQIASLLASNDKLKLTIEELQTELSDQQESINELEDRLNVAEEELLNKSHELIHSQTLITQLQQSVTQHDHILTDKNHALMINIEDITLLNHELGCALQENQILHEEIATLTEELTRLTIALNPPDTDTNEDDEDDAVSVIHSILSEANRQDQIHDKEIAEFFNYHDIAVSMLQDSDDDDNDDKDQAAADAAVSKADKEVQVNFDPPPPPPPPLSVAEQQAAAATTALAITPSLRKRQQVSKDFINRNKNNVHLMSSVVRELQSQEVDTIDITALLHDKNSLSKILVDSRVVIASPAAAAADDDAEAAADIKQQAHELTEKELAVLFEKNLTRRAYLAVHEAQDTAAAAAALAAAVTVGVQPTTELYSINTIAGNREEVMRKGSFTRKHSLRQSLVEHLLQAPLADLTGTIESIETEDDGSSRQSSRPTSRQPSRNNSFSALPRPTTKSMRRSSSKNLLNNLYRPKSSSQLSSLTRRNSLATANANKPSRAGSLGALRRPSSPINNDEEDEALVSSIWKDVPSTDASYYHDDKESQRLSTIDLIGAKNVSVSNLKGLFEEEQTVTSTPTQQQLLPLPNEDEKVDEDERDNQHIFCGLEELEKRFSHGSLPPINTTHNKPPPKLVINSNSSFTSPEQLKYSSPFVHEEETPYELETTRDCNDSRSHFMFLDNLIPLSSASHAATDSAAAAAASTASSRHVSLTREGPSASQLALISSTGFVDMTHTSSSLSPPARGMTRKQTKFGSFFSAFERHDSSMMI